MIGIEMEELGIDGEVGMSSIGGVGRRWEGAGERAARGVVSLLA